MPLIRIFVVLAAVLAGGCAATVDRSSGETALAARAAPAAKVAVLITASPAIQASKDWHAFKGEWRSAFATAAGAANVPFEYLETEPGDGAGAATLVRIHVNDYRYITPAARYGFGVMTGNAYIDSEAEFIELPSRRSLGKRKYATSSTAWQGVFSAMTDKQVAAISNEILQEVRGR